MNARREITTVAAIADTPVAALERFARICDKLRREKNLEFIGDYKIVEQTPGTWACFALCEVDKVLDKSTDLAAEFN